jgi:hypothetical protein
VVLSTLIFNYYFLASYYEPPTSQLEGIVDPPLKSQRHLSVGYGDSGTVPHIFLLRKGQNVDVGILKLYLSDEQQVDLSDVAQSSPFDRIEAHPQDKARGTAKAVLRRGQRYLWDTILVPVVQRRAEPGKVP